MAHINANLGNYDPDTGFDPIPPGDYVVEITDSDVKNSKNGNLMAVFEFEVLGPSHAGRKLWDQFVLENEVGMRRLKGMLIAAGHPSPDFLGDTEEVHGKSLAVKVKVEQKDNFDPRNRISSYKAAGGAPAAQPRPQAQPDAGPPAKRQSQPTLSNQAAPAGAAGPPPWAKPAA